MQTEKDAERVAVPSEVLSAQQRLVRNAEKLPEVTKKPEARRFLRWRLIAGGLVAIVVAIAGSYWWMHRTPPLPAAIAMGNGRIEADPIDIATKFAGRVLQLGV